MLICGAVGRAVVCNTRDLRFESSHRQLIVMVDLSEKTKLKRGCEFTKKNGRSGHKRNHDNIAELVHISLVGLRG